MYQIQCFWDIAIKRIVAGKSSHASLDIKHGNIIAINDVYYENNDGDIQQKMAQQLVEKILRKIPLMTGYVSEKTSLIPEKWIPEKGAIYPQWPLTLFVETPVINNVTGQILGNNTQVFGQADIQSVDTFNGLKGDINNDNKIGIQKVIYLLQVLTDADYNLK